MYWNSVIVHTHTQLANTVLYVVCTVEQLYLTGVSGAVELVTQLALES